MKLIFLELPDVEMAIDRVAARVRQGGHDIPVGTIGRRFNTGKSNFMVIYKPLVDLWLHYDNSDSNPTLINWSEQ